MLLRGLRGLFLLALILSSGVVIAQENLGWLTALLPTGQSESISLVKSLQEGQVPVAIGRVILDQPFDRPNAWQTETSSTGSLQIVNGQYELQSSRQGTVYWGQQPPVYENVIVQVNTRQLSPALDNGYGVMCRAAPTFNQDGYYFFISGDGYFRIFYVEGGRIADLQPWTTSDAINQGQDAENVLTAVCYRDYLAFYVNGRLVGQANDSRYRGGEIGMAGVIYEANADVRIAFDNLRVFDAVDPSGNPDNANNNGNQPDNNGNPPADAVARQTVMDAFRDYNTPIVLNEPLLQETFDNDDAWDSYIDDDGNHLRIENGRYFLRSESGNAFIYRTQNTARYTDVVVRVTMRHEEGDLDNGYGIVCRASQQNSGRGYYLFISSDGYTSMIQSDGSTYEYAVEWARADSIDIGGDNTITAICVGDYLALFVNDELAYEHTDTEYNAGSLGFSIVSFPDGAMSEVSFDDLYVWSASTR